MPILTHFEPDAQRLALFKECMDNYDVGDPDAEWPNNMLSRHTVVYGNGTIAREGESVTFAVDSDELDLCIRLANEAAELMKGVDVGMGSESSDGFSAFWICANTGDTTAKIDEGLIRSRFGGTIFPPATIKVEPVSEQSEMFNRVREDCGEDEDSDTDEIGGSSELIEKWRALFRWFNEQSDFKDVACISIGDYMELLDLPEEKYPPGTEITPCVMPRLILGLTHAGSLCGLFGFSVQT